ncbi:hypothetical protein DFH07DRAFT_787675 [Mycena maculata]|uniref:Chromo domain-containing protein n=1 Tax=Mycena maculata TaxID=230809 RepID=A0AAD7P151_9AGAR|nr:hypothetical protein DFH07DRAFT_787675 [Mycena maculata]
MAKSTKRKREESEEEEEEESYVVEVITMARAVGDVADPKDSWEYRVKWAGYDSDEDTWEPASNLSACQRLLASFWTEVGTDDNDYPEGHQVKPSQKWIKQERKRFKQEFALGKDEARKQKERADRKKEEKFAAKKAAKKRKQNQGKDTVPPSRSTSTTSVVRSTARNSVPSYPAPVPSASASTSTAPPKKKTDKVFLSSDPESDSDDDRPLANRKKRKTSPEAEDGKQAKVSKTESLDKDTTSVSGAGTSKAKPTAASNKGTKSAPPSRPVSRPASRPLTPPMTSLFSSPSPPPSSPEISLSSLKPKALVKATLPVRTSSSASTAAPPKGGPTSRPGLSIDIDNSAPSPKLPSASAAKAAPLPLPKPSAPLPSRQRSNVGTPSSSRSFNDKATPTIPASKPTSKPPTPVITPTPRPTSKPPTPVIPLIAKPAAPTIPPSAIPPHMQPKRSASSRAMNPPPPAPTVSGSGLTTKQRLSHGVLDLVPTNKEVPARKSGLSGLSFKKTASGATSTSGPPPASAASGSTSASRPREPVPPRPTIDPLFDTPEDEPFDISDSAVSMHHEEESILPPAFSRKPPQGSLNMNVDDFLKDFPPPPLKPPAALTTVAVDKQDGPPQRPPGFKKMPHKIQKKWKWTGKLLMDVGNKTDHLCDIVLNELFPPMHDGLRISIAMAATQSMHLLSFHDLVDMSEFLKTCVRMQSLEPMHQLARLGPSTDKDTEALKILARYMTKKNLVSLVPTFIDGALAGHLFLFPPSTNILLRMLRVPTDLSSSSPLIAAFLPWQTFPNEYRRPFGILASPAPPPIPSPLDWKKNMLKKKYQLALRVLKFPPQLHEWMSKANRPYCVWPPPTPEERKGPRDRETGFLLTILKQCGATRVSFKTDFRVIFVHVGALKTIHKMPLLVERRSQTCSVRFYTYGTHETVDPRQWGVREMYPFGGVVTFTPSALYEDPWGVINTMKVIDKHPLWMCYILPSVLGMASKLTSPDEDPLAAFDREVFVFDLLLRSIEDGEVSVLHAPPLEWKVSRDSDEPEEWLRDHWTNRPLGKRRILEDCMDRFSAKYANVPESEWAAAVEAEVSQDLDLMQRQPAIMKNYRRYVIIRAESDEGSAANKDGFEWLTNSSFSFNDDFLAAESQKTF